MAMHAVLRGAGALAGLLGVVSSAAPALAVLGLPAPKPAAGVPVVQPLQAVVPDPVVEGPITGGVHGCPGSRTSRFR